MLVPKLELETNIEEGVEGVGVVVLRILRESVRFVFALSVFAAAFVVVVVVAVLFVTTGTHIGVVGQVLQRQVDADALAAFQADILTD